MGADMATLDGAPPRERSAHMTQGMAVRPAGRSVGAENATVLAVSGDLDLATVDAFTVRFLEVLHSCPASLVVLDLSRVRFLAAAGLSALMIARDVAGLHGIAVRLVATQRAVLRSLEITALNTELPIFDTLTDATQHTPTTIPTARNASE